MLGSPPRPRLSVENADTRSPEPNPNNNPNSDPNIDVILRNFGKRPVIPSAV